MVRDDHTSARARHWRRIPRLDPFKAAGAAGVVFALDDSPANAGGQYTPSSDARWT